MLSLFSTNSHTQHYRRGRSLGPRDCDGGGGGGGGGEEGRERGSTALGGSEAGDERDCSETVA